jgi:hypothetical protein
MDAERSETALPSPTCRWCGAWHGPRCPTVQAIEYHPDGTVKRVEFVKPESINWQRAAEIGKRSAS